MSKEMTGAEMVIEALADQGVEHIFGYPGGAVLPIYDALFQQPKVQHILVRHTRGVESMSALVSPVTALVAPGPEVTSTQPTLPVERA